MEISIKEEEHKEIDIWSPYEPFVPDNRIRSMQEIIEDAAGWINETVNKIKESGKVPEEIRFTHVLMSNLLDVEYVFGGSNHAYYDLVTDLRVCLIQKYGIALRTLRFRSLSTKESGGYVVETKGQFSYVNQLLNKMVAYGSRAAIHISQIEARQLEVQDPQLKERIQRIRPQLVGMSENLGTSRIRIGKRKL